MKKYQRVSSSNKPKKKLLLAFALLIFILLSAALILEKTGKVNLFTNNNDPSSPESSDGINYNPPTEEETKLAEDRKAEIVKNQDEQNESSAPPTTATPGSSKRSVTPTIVSYGRDGIGGYISGITEEGGTCTATYSQGTKVITKTSAGFFDVNKTTCSSLEVASSELSPGEWKVILRYDSAKSQGVSSEVTL